MPIDVPASHRHLIEQPGTCILSTIGKAGYPQTTAVVHLLDDDGELKISLNNARQKTKNLHANPKCTLFFLDPANRQRTLEIRADAELQLDEGFAFADKSGGTWYGGSFHRHDRPGETRVIVTLRPKKVIVREDPAKAAAH